MTENPSRLTEELEQLSDAEIEARLAAAVWVDDKRTAVLRYLEDKRAGRKKEAQLGELEAVRSARDAAWAAVNVAKEASRPPKLRQPATLAIFFVKILLKLLGQPARNLCHEHSLYKNNSSRQPHTPIGLPISSFGFRSSNPVKFTRTIGPGLARGSRYKHERCSHRQRDCVSALAKRTAEIRSRL